MNATQLELSRCEPTATRYAHLALEKLISEAGPLESRGGLNLETAIRDAEILAGVMRDQPNAMQSLLDAAWQQRSPDAHRQLRELGLTEQQMEHNGGGFLWLVVVVILLYSTGAY